MKLFIDNQAVSGPEEYTELLDAAEPVRITRRLNRAAAVQAVEVLFGHKSGGEKKDAALTLVGEAVGIGTIMGESPIGDEKKFKEGLGKIIDGVVECLNASIWAKK